LCEIGNHGLNQKHTNNGNQWGDQRTEFGAIGKVTKEGEDYSFFCGEVGERARIPWIPARSGAEATWVAEVKTSWKGWVDSFGGNWKRETSGREQARGRGYNAII